MISARGPINDSRTSPADSSGANQLISEFLAFAVMNSAIPKTIVDSDMSTAFKAGIRECFPKAQRVLD